MTAGKSFVFRFEDVEVHDRELSLIKAGVVVPVEPKALRVLLFLLRNPQKLITKEELLDAVWTDAAVTESSLTRSIAKLRRALGDDFQEPRYIATVATVGYRFVCPVEVSEDDAFGSKLAHVSAETADVAIQAKRLSFWRWWPLAVAVFAVGLASLIWYLRRPLHPPFISRYTQITHDGRWKWPISTDGSRVYFLESPPSIAQVGIAGGEIVRIPLQVPFLFGVADVSPDGSDFLLCSQGNQLFDCDLWIIRIPGGPLRRLGKTNGAAFSPDGKSVIYTTLDGGIYVVRSDGTETHKLASVGPSPTDAVWSPDGDLIRFYQDDKLWQMSSNGANVHQLLSGWHPSGGQCCGSWTPDGKFFLFQSGSSELGGGQIWALDERRGLFRRPRSEPVQLTTGPLGWSSPVPGKDGKTIFAAGFAHRGELYRFEAKTKQFQPFRGGISASGVTFSKDGRLVAYESDPEGILWTANRDGSNPMRLSDPPIDVFQPRWSPDGTQIVFDDASAQAQGEIYIVSVPSGIPRKLLPKGSGKQSDPDWSPDGHKIVFGSSLFGHDPNGLIRIFDLETKKITVLPGSAGMTDPRWSPDGRSIAANSFDLLTLNIFDVRTQRWSALHLKMEMVFPEWSRDSQFIYFQGRWGDDRGIYRIRAKGGEAEEVVDLKNSRLTGWDWWTTLDPTDSPLLLRDTGSTYIYALTLEQK
jgi:Tol biopolymer transport system component/DNA-binding winged helix-turn-helix (wHTH) protein